MLLVLGLLLRASVFHQDESRGKKGLQIRYGLDVQPVQMERCEPRRRPTLQARESADYPHLGGQLPSLELHGLHKDS